MEVLVKWDTGEPTWEPLNIIEADDPVLCEKERPERSTILEISSFIIVNKLLCTSKKMAQYTNLESECQEM
jgi:hypothetical protein